MNEKKLGKLRQQVQDLRRKHGKGIRSRELEALASKVGRERHPRGKEPNWVMVDATLRRPPLSIPNHPGDLKPATAKSILDVLDDDIHALAERLEH